MSVGRSLAPSTLPDWEGPLTAPLATLMDYVLRIATSEDLPHAAKICAWYRLSAQERGTGIAQRTEAYLHTKMLAGDAVISFENNKPIGFCYIEKFQDKQYVSNSGLIVHRDYRGQGLATSIKKAAFELARRKYPEAKIFGITTSDAVMKINSDLGYRATTFSNLTLDETFWKGCASCRNYDILMRNDRRMCLCTGMIALPRAPSSEQQAETVAVRDTAEPKVEREPLPIPPPKPKSTDE